MLHTCLLAIPKGPIIEAILFQRVGYDKFLPEPIVPTGSSEPPMLKDQAVVTSENSVWFGADDRCRNALATKLSIRVRLSSPLVGCQCILHRFPIVTVG